MNKQRFLILLPLLVGAGLLVSYQNDTQILRNEESSSTEPRNLTKRDLSGHSLVEVSPKADYEVELERLISKVTPLFEVLSFEPSPGKRSRSTADEEARNKRYQNPVGAYSNYYGDYALGSSYGGGGCCSGSTDLLPIVALISLALLFLYLVVIATTTTTGRRRRRSNMQSSPDSADDSNNYVDTVYDLDTAIIDGPTWLSMVHELWQYDHLARDPACAQYTLCRMNHIATSANDQGSLAVTLSSLPLSYLLHRKNSGGFSYFMNAALMGKSGADCTFFQNNCMQLH